MVVGLCAQWCHVCRDFEPEFRLLAAELPEARFVWLDIEDDEAIVGEIDVDDFPTLAVFDRGRPLFFGVSAPRRAAVRGLLHALGASGQPVAGIPDAVVTLPQRIPSAKS